MQNNELGKLLRIHYCSYLGEIWPWIQNNLMTPYWRFYWNPEPGGFLKFSGREIALTPEYFYILPGYLPFSTFAKKPFSQFYIHFNPTESLVTPREMFIIPAEKTEVHIIRNFINRENNQENRQLTLFTAMAVLAPVLLRLPESLWRLPLGPDPRIIQIKDWISHHCDTPRNNDGLAQMVKMSRNGFIRLFESQIGESPQAYSRRRRIEQACELLNFTDLSLEAIAERTGFADRYHFSRVFAKTLLTSPAAFRKQFQHKYTKAGDDFPPQHSVNWGDDPLPGEE